MSPPSTSAISTNNSLAFFQLLPSVWMDIDLQLLYDDAIQSLTHSERNM